MFKSFQRIRIKCINNVSDQPTQKFWRGHFLLCGFVWNQQLQAPGWLKKNKRKLLAKHPTISSPAYLSTRETFLCLHNVMALYNLQEKWRWLPASTQSQTITQTVQKQGQVSLSGASNISSCKETQMAANLSGSHHILTLVSNWFSGIFCTVGLIYKSCVITCTDLRAEITATWFWKIPYIANFTRRPNGFW